MDRDSTGPSGINGPAIAGQLPNGVIITPLAPHSDERGTLSELFRANWDTNISPVQWNGVHSGSNVLRGFHLHVRHADYLVTISGRMLLGLQDFRPDSPTHTLAVVLDLKGSEPAAVTIPPGVGHAFYFPEPSVHIYAVDEYWAHDDELGCRWDDEQLTLPWEIEAPLLSPKDTQAGTCREMVEKYLRQKSQYAATAPKKVEQNVR